jgi:hypothetical protein
MMTHKTRKIAIVANGGRLASHKPAEELSTENIRLGEKNQFFLISSQLLHDNAKIFLCMLTSQLPQASPE